MRNGKEIQLSDYELSESPEINLKEYWDRLKRRKGTVISVTLAVFALGAFWTFIQKPVYTAESTILIEKEPNILSFDQVFQVESMRDDFYQTQYRLLESRTLAESVVDELELWKKEEFVGRKKSADKSANPDDHAFMDSLVKDFLGRLDVKPVRMTRLVEVSFNARDPRLAADCANSLVDSFIDFNINMKYAATEQASQFLSDQIKTLQADIEAKDKQLQQMEAQANIVALSDNETTVIDRLGELNRALTEAQIDRVKKEATWNELKNASADYIPEAINNPLIQRLREDYVKLKREYEKMQERFQPGYPELQRLKVELEAARNSLDEETKNLAKGSYSEYQTSLNKERSLERVFNDQKQEAFKMNSSAVLYGGLKIEIQNKKELLNSLLRRQSETGVEARLKGLRTSNVRIVDRARVPVSASKPNKKVNLALALILGLFGGVGLAFVFELLDTTVKNAQDVEKYSGLPTLGVIPRFSLGVIKKKARYLEGGKRNKLDSGLDLSASSASGDVNLTMNVDNSAKPESNGAGEGADKGQGENERKIKTEFLACCEKDFYKGGQQGLEDQVAIELVPWYFPGSRLSEKYRSIRTALLLSSADRILKTIAVTSAVPGEGKSVTVANLGITLAQSGKTVLIVDADLRRPRLHRIFRVKNTYGLTTFLVNSVELKKVVKSTMIPNLFLVNAGPLPPNPAELLGSEKMERFINLLKEECDYILFDLPPMLDISDALVLGAKVDGMILVIQGDKTSREALKMAREKLETLKIKTLGVIINNIKSPSEGYYYKDYYHYYGERS